MSMFSLGGEGEVRVSRLVVLVFGLLFEFGQIFFRVIKSLVIVGIGLFIGGYGQCLEIRVLGWLGFFWFGLLLRENFF